MPKLLKEWKEELVEALSEHDLLLESHHKRAEHIVLLIRNITVALALLLFLASLLHAPMEGLLKGVAYFFGAAAYLCEIVLLTDCFTEKVPHKELFMAYCFGPLYILLGLSYLLGH